MTTTSPLDLDSLTYKQLAALNTRVQTAMARAHAQAIAQRDQTIAEMKATKEAQIGAAALALGLAKEAVTRLPAPVAANGNGHARPTKATASAKRPKATMATGRPAPKRGAMKIPVKFRDPDNPANTWTGRGKSPRWMKGRPKEQFAVAAPAR